MHTLIHIGEIVVQGFNNYCYIRNILYHFLNL